MNTQLATGKYLQKRDSDGSSILLIVGIMSLFIALLGAHSEIFSLYIIGLLIASAAAISIIVKVGEAIFEFIAAAKDFKEYLKQSNK